MSLHPSDCEYDKCYFGEDESPATLHYAKRKGQTFNAMIREYNAGRLTLLDSVEPSSEYENPAVVERGPNCPTTLRLKEKYFQPSDPMDEFPVALHLPEGLTIDDLDPIDFGFPIEEFDEETMSLINDLSIE